MGAAIREKKGTMILCLWKFVLDDWHKLHDVVLDSLSSEYVNNLYLNLESVSLASLPNVPSECRCRDVVFVATMLLSTRRCRRCMVVFRRHSLDSRFVYGVRSQTSVRLLCKSKSRLMTSTSTFAVTDRCVCHLEEQSCFDFGLCLCLVCQAKE